MGPRGTGAHRQLRSPLYLVTWAGKETSLSTCHLRLLIARLSAVTCRELEAAAERQVPLGVGASLDGARQGDGLAARWTETFG